MADLPSVYFYCADQNTHRDRSRGITRYTHGLLSHLRDANAVRLTALVSRSSFHVPAGVNRITLPFQTDHVGGRLAGDHLHPLFVRRERPDIWHYPKGFLPAYFQVKGPKVGSVADVMLQFDADHHPESRSRADFAYWLALLRHSVRNLDLILTISEFSKTAILEFCDRYKFRCPPVEVTYLGVEVETAREPSEKGKGDYVLHLASSLPYKGTTWMLRQWQDLSKTRRDLPALKLVGDVDALGTGLLASMPNVTLDRELPRARLEEVMAGARALLLPSEVEGFGIPAVEAYLLGTPVAYAKDTALEEVVGPGSPGGFERTRDSFEAALRQTLELDEETIKNKAIELQSRFSWEHCLSRTLKAYRSLL